MKLVVDASVFLAFVIPEEREHDEAARFFACCETGSHQMLFPTLALVEVAGGVARRKRDSGKAALAVLRLRNMDSAKFFALSQKARQAAAQLAGRQFLRGADAVYCQLAHEHSAPLITLDLEIRDRTSGLLQVFSPRAWMESLE